MAKTREIQCIHYICEGNCDLEKRERSVISARPAKLIRRNQGENRHVLITDVRNWIGSRERNGTRLWAATENRINANERGWLLWLPSFCLQIVYTYLRISIGLSVILCERKTSFSDCEPY